MFTVITLFAVANTALINYIMGSRLLYGMSRQGLVPAPLGKVHPKRRTPHVAIVVLFVIVLVLALSGGVKQLASSTSLLLLTVFCLVNASLIVLKLRPGEERGGFEVPVVVPALGTLVCGGLALRRLYDGWVSWGNRHAAGASDDWKAPLIALALIAGISLLYVVMRRAASPRKSRTSRRNSRNRCGRAVQRLRDCSADARDGSCTTAPCSSVAATSPVPRS